ncbi:hypothetical protein ACFWNR_01200 [Streptomyces virginiae]|uniref:hypothetical protein n=1 Tax=Streptomyces virginiae TaxID=1961 RepID=UPI003668217F
MPRTLGSTSGRYASCSAAAMALLARATVERVTRPGTVRDRVLGDTLAELPGL